MSAEQAIVFIVGDSSSSRQPIVGLLESAGYLVQAYGTAEEFLDDYDVECRGCLVTDLKLPGASSLDLQDWLIKVESCLPVIIITGRGDIPTAVRAIERGAVGFLEEPYEPHQLLQLVGTAIEQNDACRRNREERADVRSRLDRLTPSERAVMELSLQGKRLKQIAAELEVTIQTASRHHISVLKKLQVESDVEMARLLIDTDQPLSTRD
ncbi:MAG: response regulator transcription factor [Planctomycetaceae bacterium]